MGGIMSDEEQLDATGALKVDEDQDEVLEEMSLEERKERLKQARWNVFLYLGIAAILFSFALVGMPFSADYDGFTSSAEKDVGFVWGVPVDGEDLFDVPMKLTVTATKVPAEANVHIGVYVLEEENCQTNLGSLTEEARAGESHSYQYQVTDGPVLDDGTYEFEFKIDPGHYCLIAQYIDADGAKTGASSDGLQVSGKVYPNQFFGGVVGLICLSLSIFAFVGAQKHGETLRSILEGTNESTESKVLAELAGGRLSSGPSGPPPAGPTGPPGEGDAVQASSETSDPAPAPAASPEPETPPSPSMDGAEPIFEATDGGYFFRKMPDGNYDQTVYVQLEDGTYAPHDA